MICVVVRPEPGNAATAARLRGAGLEVLQLPFFAIAPLDWHPPDPGAHDVLIVTSANAMRHGGEGLAALRHLPVVAVGAASATAARTAGFAIAATGTEDAAAAATLAAAQGFTRPLHLSGRNRIAIPGVPAFALYASEALPISPDQLARCAGGTVLLHSARAAHRLAALVPVAAERARIAIAALSPAVATAAGTGWRRIGTAAHPTDAALIAMLDPRRD